MLKKLFLSFFVLLLLFFSSVSTAHAQQWYDQDFSEWYTKVYGSPENEIFGERYTAAQVQWIFYSLFSIPFRILGPDLSLCIFSGDIGNCLGSLLSSTQTPLPLASTETARNSSLLGLILQDRPLSGITYFKNIIRRFHLIPEAQAQTPGFGFNALEPTLALWKGSRNIAYALLILITIVLSFMIMFRVKISPQVVISVQSALPKLAITIVLVTFSYAIAGFLIDLLYVTIGLLSIAFQSYLPGVSVIQIFNFLTKGQPTTMEFGLGVFGLFSIFIIMFVFAGAIIIISLGGVLGGWLTSIAGIISLVTGTFSFVLLIAVLLMAIAFFILVYHFVKIVWMLMKAFVNILLLTIFAPFHLILGALLPTMGFGAWVKSFVSNLSVFAITGALFFLSFIFLNQSVTLAIADFFDDPTTLGRLGNFFLGTNLPNLISPGSSSYWPPLLGIGGGGAGSNIGIALLFWGASFAIFAIIPKTAEIIQGFMSGKPFPYGTAIGEVAAGPGRIVTSGMGLISGTSKTVQGLRELNLLPSRPIETSQTQVITKLDKSMEKIEKAIEGLGTTRTM